MAFAAEATAQDKEVAALKRAKLKLETELDSERNEAFKLRERVHELELEVREGLARASHEAAKAVQAEEALRKRNDAYNTLKDQKVNAETALRSSEETCQVQRRELKRLNYQLEVEAARAAAPSKVAEEKAALEKRVHALTTELQRAQLDLEKERESRPTTEDANIASASRIARPASRQSVSLSEVKAGPTTRSRFGFQANAPSATTTANKSIRPPSVLSSNGPTRPPSSLSSHSAIPKPGTTRRSSVSADAPAGVPAQKLAQLEADLASAKSNVSSLESALSVAEKRNNELDGKLQTTQAKLRTAGDDLLRTENALMALERSSKDETAELRSELEDARDELEATRDELKREMAELAKDAEQERATLEAEIARLSELARRQTEEREQDGGSREELERLLEEARADVAALREGLQEVELELAWHEEQLQGLDDIKAEKEQLAQQLEVLDDEHAECERTIEEKDAALDELDGDLATLSAQIATLQADKAALELRLTQALEPGASLGPSTLVEHSEADSRIASVETERDELVAALASASRAHQDAEVQLAARASMIERLSLEKAAFEKERAQFESKIANISAESTDSSAKLEALSAQVADLEASLAEKDALINELSVRFAELEATAASAAADAERSSSTHLDVRAQLAAVELDRDGHAVTVRAVEERLAALSSTADDLVTSQERVAELETALQGAQNAAFELRGLLDERAQQVAELRDDDEGVADLRAELAEAEKQTASLKAAVASERALAAAAKSDTAAVEEALLDTKARLNSTEQQLTSESRERAAVKLECEALYAQIDALERSAARLEQVEQEFFAVSAELDDVRAQAEDASLAALQDIAELEARLREQEAVVDQLERQVVEADALRHILGETEARLDSLGWELRDSQAAALQHSQETEERVRSLIERAEAAEATVDQLRTELDDARHRLSDAHDSLDQAQAELAVSTSSRDGTPAPLSPSPTTPSPFTPLARALAFSPEADPTVLVLRLREERDDLRSRLDFSRTEAKIRVESLQERLRMVEENKAAELSELSMDLMDKQAAFKAECETNVKMEQTLREVRREKEAVEERLEEVVRQLKAAESRVEDATKRLAEEHLRRDEQLANRANVSALEGELDAATAVNAELRTAFTSIQSELDGALREVDHHKALAMAAGVRLEQLELLLSAERGQREVAQTSALDDFATLCETLRANVVQLEQQISAQTVTISDYERRIALLQLNLAVRVAIDDEEDLVECDEAADDPLVVQESLTSSAIMVDALQAELAAANHARSQLEAQQSTVQAQLVDAVRQADEATATADTLDRQLAEARLETSGHQKQLEATSAKLADLETNSANASAAALAAEERLAILEASLAAALARISGSEAEVAVARIAEDPARAAAQTRESQEQRIAQLEAEKASAEAALSAARDDANDLQTRLDSSVNELATAKNDLESAVAELAAGREQQASSSTQNGDLQRQVVNLNAEIARLQVSVDEKEIVHEQVQQRAVVLEEQVVAAGRELAAISESRDALQATAHAAQDKADSLSKKLEQALLETAQIAALELQLEEARSELEKLDVLAVQERNAAQEAHTRLEQAHAASEHSAREIHTLRQLNTSSQAEAAALTDEVNGLRDQVGSLNRAVQDLEGRLEQTSEQSRKNLEEVIDALQTCEQGKAAAEEQAHQLIAEIDALKASQSSSPANAELDARVAELEKLLEAKMLDVEEADEKLIDALKVQKRYSAQIERLKAKVATLQRDLASAKSASILAAAPLPAAPAPPSIGKKRPVPSEFDPVPATGARPIAVLLDKENTASEMPPSARRQARQLSSTKDGLIPLKPEHIAAAPRRAALGAVDENASSLLGEKAASAPSAASKVDSLRAKMMRMKSAQTGTLPTA